MKPVGPILGKPSFTLRNPDRTLTQDEFELLLITSEDLRYLGFLIREQFIDSAPDIRAMSTMLRRLLCEGDLHKTANLAKWQTPFTVRTRVLDYQELHPQVIVSCGGYRWGNDVLPGMGVSFAGKDIAAPPANWDFREDVTLDIKQYLDTLAFSIIGTRVRRHEIITYVANKKAAHVSKNRSKPAHRVLDNLWHGLFISRRDQEGNVESLNAVYLEMLNIINAVAESESIQRFARTLREWISTASMAWGPEVATAQVIQMPMEPLK